VLSSGETILCVSNFADVFRRPDASKLLEHDGKLALPHVAGYKAMIWPEQDGAFIVLPSPIRLTRLATSYLPRPSLLPTATRTARHEAILRAGEGGRPVRLLYTVLSETILAIRDHLRARYPGLEVRGVPDCPPGLVRYWNSKLGGRDLLLSVPESAALLPPSVVCHSIGHASSLLKRRSSEQHYFVKGNFGAGGSAVLPVRGGEAHLEELIHHWTQQVVSKKCPDWPRFDEEPLLIETAVGPPDGGRSLTADFAIDENGYVEMVGAAWQILTDGVRYEGIRAAPDDLDATVRGRVGLVGNAIALRLWNRSYTGCFNIDFVVGDDDALHLLEINVRRSAPLDQFLMMRRLYGTDWPQNMHLRFMEQIPAPASPDAEEILDRQGLTFRPDVGGIMPITYPQHGYWPVLFVAHTADQMSALLAGYERATAR
jgi:hypothetical protein